MVSIQNRRISPQQHIPIPVSCGNIVPGTTGGGTDQLLGVHGDAGGEENAEEQIGIVDLRQLGSRHNRCTRIQPCGSAVILPIPATAEHFLGRGGAGHFLKAKTPPEHKLKGFTGRKDCIVGQSITNSVTILIKGCLGRLVGHGSKGKHGAAAAEIEDNAAIPAAFVAVGRALQLLVHVDTVPAALPQTLQTPVELQIGAGGQYHLDGKAPLAHRRQDCHFKIIVTCLGGHMGQPKMLPVPFHIGQRQTHTVCTDKRLHQRLLFRAADLDHALLEHGQEGQILDACR